MAWDRSTRRKRLPPNWPALRRATFERDGYRCTQPLDDGTRCTGPADECDHLVRGDDHSLGNLRSLCSFHHRRKSAAEGAAARASRAAARSAHPSTLNRPPEAHPGILP